MATESRLCFLVNLAGAPLEKVRSALARFEFETRTVASIAKLRPELRAGRASLVILPLRAAKPKQLATIDEISTLTDAPLVVLSDTTDADERAAMIMAGADDHIPFSMEQLDVEAHIYALLRRNDLR